MTEITLNTEISVQLIKHSASDEDVVWAARVSTQGSRAKDRIDTPSGLISYLMKNRHGSPFEHASFTFLIHAPIFVAREFMRHRMASYNEESGRYKQLEPVFYVPDVHRKLRQVGKPGHYEFEYGLPHQWDAVRGSFRVVCEEAYRAYEGMLAHGVAREVARMILPVNIYTSFYVTLNARALMNFLSLRTIRENSSFPSFPQCEIEMAADQMESVFGYFMPVTWKAFDNNGRVAP